MLGDLSAAVLFAATPSRPWIGGWLTDWVGLAGVPVMELVFGEEKTSSTTIWLSPCIVCLEFWRDWLAPPRLDGGLPLAPLVFPAVPLPTPLTLAESDNSDNTSYLLVLGLVLVVESIFSLVNTQILNYNSCCTYYYEKLHDSVREGLSVHV